MNTLTVEDVTFSYKESTPVLERVSFSVTSQQRLALRAPSGFGKSTLCRLIAGFLKPTSGRILLDGAPVSESGACPIQMIWQHPEQALDPRLKMIDSLEEAGSLDRSLLDGLGIRDEWLVRYPHELSGGELQRCCIARTLRVHPRFLIADEISTMLDAITQVQIWEFLLSYCECHEVGLIMVSHSDALMRRIATRTIDLTL